MSEHPSEFDCTTKDELIAELVDELEDNIRQACYDPKDDTLESYGLSAHASGIRLLAKLGKVKIIHDRGRVVIAKYPKRQEEPKP